MYRLTKKELAGKKVSNVPRIYREHDTTSLVLSKNVERVTGNFSP